jgi:hypothetical protein
MKDHFHAAASSALRPEIGGSLHCLTTPRGLSIWQRFTEETAIAPAICVLAEVREGNAPDDSTDDNIPAQAKEIIDRWLRKKDKGVLIFDGVPIQRLPKDMQIAIVDAVGHGQGVLLIPSDDAARSPLEEFLDELDRDAEAENRLSDSAKAAEVVANDVAADFLRIYPYEKGRFVVLRPPHGTGQSVASAGSPWYLATFLEGVELRNAALWLAQVFRYAGTSRLPSLAGIAYVAPKGPQPEDIPPDLPTEYIAALRDSITYQPTRRFELKRRNADGAQGSVVVAVRRPDASNGVQYALSEPFSKADSSYYFDLLIHPGRFWVEAWLKEGKHIRDWCVSKVEILGWPFVSHLSFNKEVILPNDELEIRAQVPPVISMERVATVYALATDTYQREVALSYASVGHEGGEVRLRLPLADLVAPLIRVEVFALDGEPHPLAPWEKQSVGSWATYIPVIQRANLPSHVHVYEIGFPFIASESSTAQNTDTIAAPADDAAFVAAARRRYNFLPVLTPTSVQVQLLQPCCLQNKEVAEPLFRALAESVGKRVAGSLPLYKVAEGVLPLHAEPNACPRTACAQRFGQRLSQQFPTVAAMNDVLGTQVSDWEEVVPQALEYTGDSERNIGWLLYARFQEESLHPFIEKVIQTCRAVDRAARIGIEIGGGDRDVPDVFRFLYTFDWVVMPADAQAPLLASACFSENIPWFLVPEGEVPSIADGGSLTKKHGIRLPWRSRKKEQHSREMKEAPSAMWQESYACLYGACGLWRKEQSQSNANGAYCFKPNLGKAPLPDEGVQTIRDVRHGVLTLLQDAKPQFSPIAVYLPENHFFLQRNGIPQLPDVVPWLNGVLCALNELGYTPQIIRRETLEKNSDNLPWKAFFVPNAALDDNELAALEKVMSAGILFFADACPGQWDENGRPRKNNPLQPLFAKGAPSVIQITKEGAGYKELREAIDKALETAAIVPTLPVSMGDGSARFYGIRREYVWDAGVRIWAVLASHTTAPTRPVAFDLPKGSYAWDVSEGKLLPNKKHLKRPLSSDFPCVISLLPYRIESFSIRAPEAVVAGKRLHYVLSLRAEPPAGRHVAEVSLWKDNKPLDAYRARVVIENGVGEGFFPLAQNDLPGKYRIEAVDLLTGLRAETFVTIHGSNW